MNDAPPCGLALRNCLAPGRNLDAGEEPGLAIGIANDESVDRGAIGKIQDQQAAGHVGAGIVEQRAGGEHRLAEALQVVEMGVAVVGADPPMARFVEAVQHVIHGSPRGRTGAYLAASIDTRGSTSLTPARRAWRWDPGASAAGARNRARRRGPAAGARFPPRRSSLRCRCRA